MVNMIRPEEKVKELSEEKKDDIMKNFTEFRDFLGHKVETGEKVGIGEDALTKNAKRLADYLAKHEEPRNREEPLLREMWNVSNKDERNHIAHVLVKLVDRPNDYCETG
ncbi:DUF3243 domain-containing protein [Alteribacillus sp. JSM 102045]|uniref:DUF3243 domain-containing protein n=1 Tax=Alteribacillus sp. JSM 102045 TaxID=1562101 RepID=UPI0035BF40DC